MKPKVGDIYINSETAVLCKVIKIDKKKGVVTTKSYDGEINESTFSWFKRKYI